MEVRHIGYTKTIAIVLIFTGVYVVTNSKSRIQVESERIVKKEIKEKK
jgi:hypothetical protein